MNFNDDFETSPPTQDSTRHTKQQTKTSNKPKNPIHASIPKDFPIRDKSEEQLIVRRKVMELITLLELDEVPHDLLPSLADAVSVVAPDNFDEEFDLREELSTQLKMVRAVRNSILNSAGQIREDTTVSEVKSVLDASMKLAQMLTKANKEIVNIERIQAVEAAFLETIADLDEARQKEFVAILEKRMKAQKALLAEPDFN